MSKPSKPAEYPYLVIDNSKKSSAVTAPSVARTISFNDPRLGYLAPFRQRVTETLDTPIRPAISSSLRPFWAMYTSSFMRTMYHSGTKGASPICTIIDGDRTNESVPPSSMGKFPNRIAEFRAAKGLTQTQLAERCNTTHATIGRLERGKRGLSEKWMRIIGKALSVNPADLLKPASQEALEMATANAADILADMTPEKRQQWLELGQALLYQQKAS